ncbi:MAG: hypothetical protein FD178_2829 [Ignavibacteria bacterium]|nr:MAG: hypothetical protein FD178_2829 [Ignavibacteria bacterium]
MNADLSATTECPVCGVQIQLAADAVQGELIECSDCGTELEIISRRRRLGRINWSGY